jgi:hypothetical protein
MQLLRRICVGCANIVNRLTVKCAVVIIPLPFMLHLDCRDCIQFGTLHGLHKHTQDDTELDVITSTYRQTYTRLYWIRCHHIHIPTNIHKMTLNQMTSHPHTHKHTQDDTQLDVITSTYPQTPEFQNSDSISFYEFKLLIILLGMTG